jgi:Cu2+-containing amine oxidase
VEGFFANPIGFYLTFRMGTLDPDAHVLKLIVYNGQSFDSIADFKTAYATAGAIRKMGNRPLANVLRTNSNGIEWASLAKHPNPRGVYTGRGAQTRRNSNIIAPQVREPGGKRFLVQDNYVDYLGWNFNVGHNPITGLKVYNVRYRGKSVAYEIGLSEALAVYSGIVDLVQAATVYGDTAWGLGASANEMVRGIDCPSTGMLSDVTFLMDSGEPTTGRNTICIFEQASQTPLRRHSNGDSYGGLATHSLVVRILLPVYNYDYVLDHIFHLNGAVELRGSTSGYLQSTFWSPLLDDETKSFGQRIGPFTAGTTHDHVLNFKIDLDVQGTTNQLVKTTTRAVRVTPKVGAAEYFHDLATSSVQ